MRYKKEKILTADVCLKLFFTAVKETAKQKLKKIVRSRNQSSERKPERTLHLTYINKTTEPYSYFKV